MTLYDSPAVSLAQSHADRFRPAFLAWLEANPHVYDEFEARALQVARVRRHYGARTIMEVIRHDTVVGNLTGEWKIDNSVIPDCARLFALLHPEYAGLFEFRGRGNGESTDGLC